MSRSKYFKPSELVQKELLEKHGVDYCMDRIGQTTLDGLDKLRYDYQRAVELLDRDKSIKDVQIIINGTWGFWRTKFKDSGVRSPDCKIGAPRSAHKEYRAFDLKCRHMDILIGLAKDNSRSYHISRIENPLITKTWLHCEFSPFPDALVIFNP